jgi:ATP-binding cassette subfamily C protein
VRGFLGSPGLVALFDLPWVPVFLVFVYMLHPYLGALTVAGAVVSTARSAKPIALSTSALRAFESAMALRATTACCVARSGRSRASCA